MCNGKYDVMDNQNKPYEIIFSTAPSPIEGDVRAWTRYEVISNEDGKLLTGSTRQGTEEELTPHIHQIMINRSNSLQLIGSGNKRKKSISLGNRPIMVRN